MIEIGPRLAELLQILSMFIPLIALFTFLYFMDRD